MKDRIIGTPDDRYYAAKLSQLFYRNLKNVCVLKGTSIGKLEERIGVSPGYFSRWRSPGIPLVAAVLSARILDVSIDDLLMEDEHES